MKKIWTFTLGLLVFPLIMFAQTAGSLDQTFSSDGIIDLQIDGYASGFNRLKLQSDGKILATGFKMDSSVFYPYATMARFNEDGSFDTSFGTDGIYVAPFWAIGFDFHIMADNKILTILDVAYSNQIGIMRLLPNGVPDSTFGINGVSGEYLSLYSPRPIQSDIQPDGKILIYGYYYDYINAEDNGFIARMLPNGKIDSTFGGVGFVTMSAPNYTAGIFVQGGGLQPDGKIVIPGRYGTSNTNAQWFLARYMPNGDKDLSFGGDGVVLSDLGNDFWEGANTILLLPDGKIIAAGYAKKLPGYHFTMVRYLPDGTIDNTFGLGGKAQIAFDCCYSDIFDLQQQSDGKLVACGYSKDETTRQFFSLARFKPNGVVDQTFGDGGRVVLSFDHDSTGSVARSVAIQPDGRILSAGATTDSEGYDFSALVVRLNPGTVPTHSPQNLDFQLVTAPNPVPDENLFIAYTLPESSNVSISLYDLLGRKLSAAISNQPRPAGDNKEQLSLPSSLPSGQYLLKLETETGNQLVKIVKSAR